MALALLWLFTQLPALAAGPAQRGPLVLDALHASVDAWPAVRLLSDPAHALTADQAIAAITEPGRFMPPTGPHANLGRRHDTVWLHLALELRDASTGWWVAVDYPSIDELEVILVQEGRIVHRALTGDHLALADRAAATRQLAAELPLSAGRHHDLLLRVRTTSAMILPLTLVRTSALVADDGLTQMVQGVVFGLGVGLLIYTLIGAAVLRDPMFVWFAIAIVATTLFFSSYLGIAAQYLWPRSEWLTRNAPPLMLLLLLSSGTMFVDRSLEMPLHAPRASLAMRGLALVTLIAALLFVGGALGYRAATAVVTYTGLLPMVIALPVAFRRARAGDRVAWLTFVGWALYSSGLMVFTLLQGGRLDFSLPAHHALQASSVSQMGMWVLILGLRANRLRQQVAHTRRERDRLLTIARTDPLTGLLNRRGLEQAMQDLLTVANEESMVAIYVIDLDAFKPVNDQHGHDAGDELLVQVGVRLKRAMRAADLVSRTGGDEFVVVAGQLKSVCEAEQIGHKLLACCDSRFELSSAVCSVGMTVGYALAPQDGREAVALIKRADAAMYAGKQAGKHRVARTEANLATT